MAALDWTETQKKYHGQWVAFADDNETVVGHGKTIAEARALAKANGVDDPIFAEMPEEIITYLGRLI